MTSRAMQVRLPSGEVIWAQVRTDGPTNVAAGGLQHLDVDELRSTISGVTRSVREAIEDLVPDQVQVEFGLSLTVKSGKLTSVLAEAGGTASLKVSLAWGGQQPFGAPASEASGADGV
ncbi:CU044_2847 family protein [Micromonospora sediminicola]|uniref:CU044_2847 family protein n=1 Tax=Micromonospora sediminicola TaxID=946078 RepID=UPI0033F49325